MSEGEVAGKGVYVGGQLVWCRPHPQRHTANPIDPSNRQVKRRKEFASPNHSETGYAGLLVHVHMEGGSPEEVLLHDRHMLIIVVLYTAIIITVLYILPR